VVVDTTRDAEFDFASHNITDKQLDSVGENLRALPISHNDRTLGSIRIRDVLDDKEVAFIISHEKNVVAILILGLGFVGALEEHLNLVTRAWLASLPPGAQELLKGRRRTR
jgi:hypothetical protein